MTHTKTFYLIYKFWRSIWHFIWHMSSELSSPPLPSEILSGKSSDILSGICIWQSLWHSIWYIFRNPLWVRSGSEPSPELAVRSGGKHWDLALAVEVRREEGGGGEEKGVNLTLNPTTLTWPVGYDLLHYVAGLWLFSVWNSTYSRISPFSTFLTHYLP